MLFEPPTHVDGDMLVTRVGKKKGEAQKGSDIHSE